MRPKTSSASGRTKGGFTGPPRAVILIDDVGHNLEAARALLRLDLNLSFAILPHLPHSRRIAEEARARGREVILHLPLEPKDYPRLNPGPGGLFSTQSPAEWRRLTRSALDAVPGIAGVNNHMGSLLTERREAMEVILAEVKARGLYFVDSYTTVQSVAYDVARRLGLRVARRTIFLDNEIEEEKISAQIDRLLEEASRTGRSLGIAHPHRATAAALRRALPRIRASGVAVVQAGALVR